MSDWQIRTRSLLGDDAVKKLNNASVAVFGVGGVGSFAAEALVRAGVGRLTFVDGDVVAESNVNRQLVADRETIGRSKAEVMKERAERVSAEAEIEAVTAFYSAENADSFPLDRYDFILDCIDTVSSKIELICRANAAGVPVISCMGAGNKLDPTRFEVADIYKTSVCPLARVMRYELKKRGIKSLPVVYSKEEPKAPDADGEKRESGRPAPASVSFVPSVAGLIMAGEVIKRIAK